MERVPLAEAARRLGITITACRKRVARGSLPAVKLDGHWFIDLDGVGTSRPVDAGSPRGVVRGTPAGEDTGTPPPALVAVLTRERDGLAGEVAWLRAELEARRGEVRELHTLLAQAQARPLPAAAETPATPNRPAPAATPPRH